MLIFISLHIFLTFCLFYVFILSYLPIYIQMPLNLIHNKVVNPGNPPSPEMKACEQVMLNTLLRDPRLDRAQVDALMDTFRRIHAEFKRADNLRSNGVPSRLSENYINLLSYAFLEPVNREETNVFIAYYSKILSAKTNADPHHEINRLLDISRGIRANPAVEVATAT